MTIAEYLRTHCKPIDEVDDAAIYRVDKLIEGRFPEFQGLTMLRLDEEDVVSPHSALTISYRVGSLAREFTPKDN